VLWHGTCMLSRAAGAPLGVTRGSHVTVVRMPKSLPNQAQKDAGITKVWNRMNLVIDAFTAILEDVIKKNLQGKAVVSYSWVMETEAVFTIPPSQNSVSRPFYDLLEKMIQKGITIVVSSGNQGLKNFPNVNSNSDP
jgi:hypothetical protein